MTAPDSQACCVVSRTCVRKCFYWINHVVWEQRTTLWYIRSTERCIQDTDQQPACFSCLNALIEINLWMFDLFLSPTDPLPGRLFFLFSAWTDWHHITHSHVSFTKSPQSYRGADKRSLMSEKCPGWGHQISWILSIFLSFSCKLILQQLSFSGKTVFPKNN